jgi:capsular exopolysaccharide synthesis family protein
MVPAHPATHVGAAGVVTPHARPSVSVLETIWRARRMVACVALVFVVAAAAYVLWATPIHASTARILVERDTPVIINGENEQALSSSKNYLHTQCAMLKATPIAEAAVRAIDVKSLATFATVSDPVSYLKSKLIVELSVTDDIISCTLEGPYPQEVTKLVNAVVAAYIEFQSAHKRSTAGDVLKVLQSEKVEREEELRRKTDALLAFKRANGMLSFSDQKGNVITQRLGRLSDEVTNAQLLTITATSDHQAARAAADGDRAFRSEWVQGLRARGELSDIDAMYQRLCDSAVALEVRLAGLSAADNHPQTRSARQILSQVREKIADQEQRMAQAYLVMTERKLEAAKSNEALIKAQYKEQEQLAHALNSRMAESAVLEASVRQAERYCELLEGRINELTTVEQAPALNVRVLESAQATKSPVRPAAARLLAGALALGLFFGSGIALVRGRMEQRMMSLPEIVALLEMPVLGAIPYIPRRLREGDATMRPGVYRNHLSEVAEAHRMIRASICLGLPRDSARTILVTSATCGEGKSTVSSGLAWAMSEAGERVLLLDADFRKPVQHTIFNLANKSGVTDVIAGTVLLKDAISPSGISGLDVLPCGSVPATPTEVINSEAFADMLQELAGRYDRIVLDSSPAGLVADARILAAMADVTVLVVRADRTTRRQALHALHGLTGIGARLHGVIVNVAKNPFNDLFANGGFYYRHDPSRADAGGNGRNGNGEGNGYGRSGGNGDATAGDVARHGAAAVKPQAPRQLPVEG